MKKRWLTLSFSCLLTLSLLGCTGEPPEQSDPPKEENTIPPSSVTYKITPYDHSLYDEEGTLIVESTYDLVTISGSPFDSEINEVLEREYEQFQVRTEEWSGYTSIDVEPHAPYCDSYSAQVTYLDERYFSVLLFYNWYMGGTTSYGGLGYTFDLSTGKRLDLGDLFPTQDRAELLTELKTLVTDFIQKETQDENLIEEVRLNLEEGYPDLQSIPYHIASDGEIILCFGKYAIAYGAAGEFVIPTGMYI